MLSNVNFTNTENDNYSAALTLVGRKHEACTHNADSRPSGREAIFCSSSPRRGGLPYRCRWGLYLSRFFGLLLSFV